MEVGSPLEIILNLSLPLWWSFLSYSSEDIAGALVISCHFFAQEIVDCLTILGQSQNETIEILLGLDQVAVNLNR